MNIEIVIESVVGLVVLLTLLIVLFLVPWKRKKKKLHTKKSQGKEATQRKREEVLPFDELRAVVRRRSSSSEDLEMAIDQVIKHYAKIHPKLGIRNHPDFDKYVDLIVHLVRHKNTNKDLIIKLDKALTHENPQYKAELNDTLTKALNSLGG